MNVEERNKIVSDIFDNLNKLMNSKGVEYSRSEDVLANFKRGEELGITPLQKLMTYASKHWDSIVHYTKNGKVESNESIDGRIFDLINYLILYKCLLEEQNKSDTYRVTISGDKTTISSGNTPAHTVDSTSKYTMTLQEFADKIKLIGSRDASSKTCGCGFPIGSYADKIFCPFHD